MPVLLLNDVYPCSNTAKNIFPQKDARKLNHWWLGSYYRGTSIGTDKKLISYGTGTIGMPVSESAASIYLLEHWSMAFERSLKNASLDFS